ncbi:hypothetical protein A4A49_59759, partial [Nicotiana attenuata]
MKLTQDLGILSPNMRNSTPQSAAEKTGMGNLEVNIVPLVDVSSIEAACNQKEKSIIEENITNSKSKNITSRTKHSKEQQTQNQTITKAIDQEAAKIEIGKNEKKWTNLFTGNKMATRGMDLVFIPPTIHDGVKK